jgi:sigma-B regulation protein RsbU (phosphoserine phosphatase)
MRQIALAWRAPAIEERRAAMRNESERPVTILIVDDDTVSVVLLTGLLQREGFSTICVADGAEGISLATHLRPDLILLDVKLPTGHGPSICGILKKEPATAEIPILFISGDTDTATKVECFDAGGQDYITKPYETREVLARIRTHLRLGQTQKALAGLLAHTIQNIAQAQQVLQPYRPQDMPAARFEVYYRQLSQAGGDFYDVIPLSENVFDYITADVSGHNIGIALVTSALKVLLAQNCSPVLTPAETLSIVNRVIPSVLQPGQYVSVSWVRVNRKTGKALLLNAGQPPVIYIPSEGQPRRIECGGDIVGIFEQVAFEQVELSVSPGDRLLLYSDGLIEVENKSPAARTAGIDRILAICVAPIPLNQLIDEIPAKLFGQARPNDDVILLGVEI